MTGDGHLEGDDGAGEQVGDRHQAMFAHGRLVRRLSPIVMETRLGTMSPGRAGNRRRR